MKVDKRRRRENKTDYLIRKKMLSGEKPRVVFRKTNKYVIAQYVLSKEAKDSVKIGLTSKILLKYGWPEKGEGSLKSIPAAYLTGYIIGKKILKDKLETPIVDLGMEKKVHKTKIFACIKGLVDAGLDIKTKEDTFPEENRLAGESIKTKIDVKKIKSKIDAI
jgi:large subunit ribosomal protein L18